MTQENASEMTHWISA